jgi:membrane associated rhomboid family serine protease
MIPITDDVTKSWFAPLTWLLIIATSIISIWALNTTEARQLSLLQHFTYIGNTSSLSVGDQVVRMFSATLLHADYFHLFFNMLFLFAFGLSLEKRLGALRFLVLYVGSAMSGWLVYGATNHTDAFALGASGAISGIIVTYLFLFPQAKFLSAVLILWIVKFFYIRAWVYIVLWISVQIWSVKYDTDAHVAYGAHFGGILFGVFFGVIARYFNFQRKLQV